MLFSIVFGCYSALLAYLIGEGQSFSIVLTGGVKYAIFFGIAFWLIMTLLLRKGLKELKKIETWGVTIIILIIIFFFIWFLKDVNPANLTQINYSMFFFPFGITLFALIGFTAIPEVKAELKGNEKLMKKSILIGSLIPVILYALFSFIFVGMLGRNVNEIATLSFGRFIPILGIFTMLTSYFVLSFVLKDVFTFDLHNKKIRFLFVSIIPLALYLIISIFNLAGFIKVLGIGGAISGGITAIIVLLMNIRSKKLGNRKPEYSIPINWIIITILSLIFIAGIIYELFF